MVYNIKNFSFTRKTLVKLKKNAVKQLNNMIIFNILLSSSLMGGL